MTSMRKRDAFTGMAIMAVTIFVMNSLIGDKIQSTLVQMLVAGMIAGGLFIAVDVAKRGWQKRKRQAEDRSDGKG